MNMDWKSTSVIDHVNNPPTKKKSPVRNPTIPSHSDGMFLNIKMTSSKGSDWYSTAFPSLYD